MTDTREAYDQPITALMENVLLCAGFEPGQWSATTYAVEFGEKLSNVQAIARHAQLRGFLHYTGWKVRRLGDWDEARMLVSGPKVGRQVPGTAAVADLLNWLQTPAGYAPTAEKAGRWAEEKGIFEEGTGVSRTTRLLHVLAKEGYLWTPREWVATAMGMRALLFQRPDLRTQVDTLREHVRAQENPTPRQGQLWKHFKGGEYEVLGSCRLQTHGPDDGLRAVLYRGADGEVWARPEIDFTTRFTCVI